MSSYYDDDELGDEYRRRDEEALDYEIDMREEAQREYERAMMREHERQRDLQEGMPGTWSHCGKKKGHGAHRHTVIFNEGPYYNILCKGTPGDPNAGAPLGRIVYDNE